MTSNNCHIIQRRPKWKFDTIRFSSENQLHWNEKPYIDFYFMRIADAYNDSVHAISSYSTPTNSPRDRKM